MNKVRMLAVAFAAAALATNAQAQETLSYSFAELSHVSISNGSSFRAKVQYEVKPQIYILGGYTYSEADVAQPAGTATINAGHLGGGYHTEVAPGIDMYGEVGYMMGTATVEITGFPPVDADVKGAFGTVGARGFVKPKIEIDISAGFGPDDFGGFSLLGRYYFRDRFSVAGGIIEGDIGLGLRANF